MASISPNFIIWSPLRREPTLSPTALQPSSDALSKLRSAAFSAPIGGSSKGNMSCRAMAVAKFKGTRMREQRLAEMIEKKVLEAEEVCQDNQGSDECKVAWDEVEEVSQAKADLRRRLEKEDPLQSFCDENPETDECRVYDD